MFLRSRRSRILVGSLLAIGAIAAVTLAVIAQPLRIAYHLKSLDRIHEKFFSEPTRVEASGLVGYGTQDLFEQQKWHRDQLVKLGHFFHKVYEMENLPDAEGVTTALWGRLVEEFPESRYPLLSSRTNVLEVWDFAEMEPKWDAFAEKHNVHDFVEKFMEPKVRQAESDAPG